MVVRHSSEGWRCSECGKKGGLQVNFSLDTICAVCLYAAIELFREAKSNADRSDTGRNDIPVPSDK